MLKRKFLPILFILGFPTYASYVGLVKSDEFDAVAELIKKEWSVWVVSGEVKCSEWIPLNATIDYNQIFEQSRTCHQKEERTRDVYVKYEGEAQEKFKEIEVQHRYVSSEKKQNAMGEKDYPITERYDSWSNWINKDPYYNCDLLWLPETSEIDLGQSFTQNKDCSQNQERERAIYDVYLSGHEEFKEIEYGSRITTIQISQQAVGTKNIITNERADSWSVWTDKNGLYDCSSWTPDPLTVNWGDSFNQNRDCFQDQERTRNVYDVWTDNTETLNRVENENQTLTKSESQQSIGTKDYVTGTSYGSWSSYSNSGSYYGCSSYSPSTSTVTSGTTFTQTRSCSQNQTRSRSVYNVWASGKTTYSRSQSGTRVLSVTHSRSATGTKQPPYAATKYCPSGYSISAYYSTKCYRNDAYYPPEGQSCPSGWSTTPAGRCAVYTSVRYRCNSGDRLSGSTCYP